MVQYSGSAFGNEPKPVEFRATYLKSNSYMYVLGGNRFQYQQQSELCPYYDSVTVLVGCLHGDFRFSVPQEAAICTGGGDVSNLLNNRDLLHDEPEMK